MTTMSKAVRKAHEHDAALLRKSIARQEASLADKIKQITEERQARIDIDKRALDAITLALSEDDAEIAGVPV